jgi:hypothetical protein
MKDIAGAYRFEITSVRQTSVQVNVVGWIGRESQICGGSKSSTTHVVLHPVVFVLHATTPTSSQAHRVQCKTHYDSTIAQSMVTILRMTSDPTKLLVMDATHRKMVVYPSSIKVL